METQLDAKFDVKPIHLLAGLGAAERSLLATCLTLIDESKLEKRLETLYQSASDKIGAAINTDHQRDKHQTEDALSQWHDCPLSDNELRVILWIKLRGLLELSPKLTGTKRGLNYIADDMAARLIHGLSPSSLAKTSKRWLEGKGWLTQDAQEMTLTDIVLPVLDEILQASPTANESNPNSEPEDRYRVLSSAVVALNRLTGEEQRKLLNDIDANKLNDAAMLRTLAVGGSLGAFGGGVSAAGFSSYILAAQTSAFVPLVSGPGLVSFVSVLSNPITIIALTGGGAWYFATSTGQRISARVSARIAALMVIRGLQSQNSGLESLRYSFMTVAHHRLQGYVNKKVLSDYQSELELIKNTDGRTSQALPDDLIKFMDKPVQTSAQRFVPKSKLDSDRTGDERINAAALATMTVGDVLYSVAAVDPTVIRAADFSRSADINGRIEFSELASSLLGGNQESIVGATSHLKGYVAEKAVAAELASEGHSVTFPDASNAPGLDLIVDGNPYQVKFHADLTGINAHFEQYDYPVIANSELSGQIPAEWSDRVFFIDGLGNELVTDVTERSLEAGNQVFDPAGMEMIAVISATRGLLAYRSSQVTGRQAIEQIMLDGVVRGSLFGAGGVAGTLAGGMIFGPAGAWVIGPGASILAQMQTTKMTLILKSMVTSNDHQAWEKSSHEAIDALQEVLNSSLTKKSSEFRKKFNAAPKNPAGDYLAWHFADDDRHTMECQLRLKTISREQWPIPEQRTAELLRVMSVCAVFPAVYQRELSALSEQLKSRPGLLDLLNQQKVSDAWNTTQELSKDAVTALSSSRAGRWFKGRFR